MYYITVVDRKIDIQQKSGIMNSFIYLFIHFKVCVAGHTLAS